MDPTRPAKERHFRVPASVFLSEAFRTLPPSALKLWIDLRSRVNSYNNGLLDATMRTMSQRGWRSPETLHRALRENLKRGLLIMTRHGKPGPARICSLFGFTDLAITKDNAKFVAGAPPSHAYAAWKPGMSMVPPRSGSQRIAKSRDTKIEPTSIRFPGHNQYESRIVDLATSSEIDPRKIQ